MGAKVSIDVPDGKTFTGTDEVTIIGGGLLEYSIGSGQSATTPSGVTPFNSGAEIAFVREDFTGARTAWNISGSTGRYVGFAANVLIPITEWEIGA